MDCSNSIRVLNEVGGKITNWVHLKDLPELKPVLIVECYKQQSRFTPSKSEVVVKLQNVGLLTLPSRFSDTDDSIIKFLNSGQVFLVKKEASGKSFILNFICDPHDGICQQLNMT